MADLIVIIILLVLIGASVIYIRKEKKRGVKCIGCPDGATCAKKQGGCGCGGTGCE